MRASSKSMRFFLGTGAIATAMSCNIRHIKDLDISSEKAYSRLSFCQISFRVNLEPNCNLLEMAMKECHPKGFESEASEGLRFPSRGFFI
jgi:hypothetical protein